MRLANRSIVLCAAVAIFWLPRHARAEEFRSESSHFRLQLPPGWAKSAPQKLQELKNANLDPKSIVHGAFDPGTGLGFPLITIHEVRESWHRFVTYDQMESAVNNEFRHGLERGQGNIKIGKITLDRDKNRFTAEIESGPAHFLKSKGVIYGFLGKEGIVIIQCYTFEGGFQQQRPQFDAMADSFRFDSGFEFEPFNYARAGWIVVGVIGSLCCLVVVVIVVIVLIVMAMRKR